MMTELAELKRAVRAHQVILVVDGMIGQESVRVGQTFAERVGVDGLVLSKMDGDARGGAALSLRQVTGKPILFLGVARSSTASRCSTPAGWRAGSSAWATCWAGREGAVRVSEQDALKLAERMKKSDFTLEDFLEQLRSVRKMGPLEDLMKMVPGMPKGALEKLGPQKDAFKKYEAILLSMTVKERRNRGCSTAAGASASPPAAAPRSATSTG